MGLSAFDDVKATLRWAKSEIVNFESACEAFVNSHPCEIYFVERHNPLRKIGIVRQVKEPTDDMRRSGYRVVSDLRDALDQATHAATIALERGDKNRTNFPSGKDLNDLRKRMSAPKGPMGGIPVELHGAIEDFEPYWFDDANGKGNSFLRSFIKLANPNKHRIPLKAKISMERMDIYASHDVDLQFTNREMPNNEIEWFEILVTGPKPDFKAAFYPMIFIDADPITLNEAVPAFNEFAGIVEHVILKLEAETERLLNA